MSLQNLCLNTIVEDFDRYFLAFSNCDDVYLKRKFEFLQRMYSQEIATKLFEEYKIEEKHAHFVINKYLTSLDTKWFENCSWKEVIARLAEIGPKIKKIKFFQYSEKRPWEEIFCHLPNLEVMHYLHDCDDKVLRGIAEYCPNIQEIEIHSSYNITDEGLKSLCKVMNGYVSCSKLKNIIIESWDERIQNAAKYLVQNLPSLEVFEYYLLPQLLYDMHYKDLPTIDKVAPYKFTKLDLLDASNTPHFDDLLKVCFSLCPNLKSLSCPVMKPQHLNLISLLSNLETLYIDNCHKDNLDVNDFLILKGSKLISLHLRNCLVSLSTLAKNCPYLNLLHLVNGKVECDVTSIPTFKKLAVLTVEILKLDDTEENLKSACLILSSSPKLESMTFRRCNLTLSEVKAVILKCCEQSLIKKIDFCSSMVEKQFILDILFTCHSLSVFNLDECHNLDSDDEEEIYKVIDLLPNNPDIFFSEQLSASDYDDILSDYYDYDNFVFDYDDNDDDDEDEEYPYFCDPYDYADYDDDV